jgi:hypothetical protein
MAPKAATANSGAARKATAATEPAPATSSGICLGGGERDSNHRRRGDHKDFRAKRYFFQH